MPGDFLLKLFGFSEVLNVAELDRILNDIIAKAGSFREPFTCTLPQMPKAYFRQPI